MDVQLQATITATRMMDGLAGRVNHITRWDLFAIPITAPRIL